MNRMMLATGLAIGFHALLLGVGLEGNRTLPKLRPVPSRLTMSLSYRQPVEIKEERPRPVVKQERREPPAVQHPVAKLPEAPKQKMPEKPRVIERELVPPPPAVSPEPIMAPEVDLAAQTSALQEVPHTVIKAEPRYALNPPPRYPRLARQRGWEGLVMLEVFVDSTGRAREVRVGQGCGYGVLDKAARKAVEKWRFSPGEENGRHVAMWVQVPVRFELRKGN